MHIRKLLYGPYSEYVIAIILGFGLSTLFRASCNGRKCMVHKAAPIENILNKIYKYDKKCYTFSPETVVCDSSKEILEYS